MQQTSDHEPYFNHIHGIFFIMRRVQLGLGCLALGYIIYDIKKRRLQSYNTTKMFMWTIILYLIGMLVVLAHENSYISAGHLFAFTSKSEINNKNFLVNVLIHMRRQNSTIWCALQTFINLFCYNIGYLCSVLIAYNVYCVLNDNYRNFTKKVMRNKFVIMYILTVLAIHIHLWILTFLPNKNARKPEDYNFIYSYGPAGLPIEKQGLQATLIFFCSMCINPLKVSGILPIIGINLWIYGPIVGLFLVHFIILCINRSKMKKIQQNEQYFNSKQIFIMNSGKLSLVVFLFQFMNFVKGGITPFIYPNIIANFLFDFYPFVFLFFFWRYTREKNGILYGTSTIISDLETN